MEQNRRGKKPLSSAERQRLYRQRRDADTDRRSAYLQKERDAWLRRKLTGRAKSVLHMTDRERRSKRKYWRQAQQKSREKRRFGEQSTPPATPTTPTPSDSRQSQQGRKKIRRENRKCYREIDKLKKEVARQKRRAERYKKRAYREVQSRIKCSDTPRSRTKKLLRNWHKKVPERVRKTLTFHFAVVDGIKEKYRHATCERTKQAYARFVSSKIIHRYRMRSLVAATFGMPKHMLRFRLNADLTAAYRRRKRCDALTEEQTRSIQEFFCRDDVSRLMPDKKATLTRNKVKQQKRLLSDSILNAHRKYISENPKSRVSYPAFCRLRPFYVVIPKLEDRRTCMCKSHENLAFIVTKLYQLHIIPTRNLETLADSIVCDSSSKSCMYRECEACKNTVIPLPSIDNIQVEYVQWQTTHDENTNCSITSKRTLTASLLSLVQMFEDRLNKFCRHLFNIRHQYTTYRKLKERLQSNECIIHVDFSENYSCKYSQEIQAVHFGGSHKQATLHTGVLYVGGATPSTVSFCTISPSRKHDPSAIWAHLEPVFQFMRDTYPSVKVVHFYSDGPVTQYRQKLNFFLFCTELYKQGYEAGSWNFWEASHGKGAPDGIGGCLKRTADKLVSQGVDIPDAESLYQALNSRGTSVNLFYVESEAVENMLRKTSEYIAKLPAVPGTMRLHQVQTGTHPKQIVYRDVSCYCSHPDMLACTCYDMKTFEFPDVLATATEVNENGPMTDPVTDEPSADTLTEIRPSDTQDSLISVSSVSADALVGYYCVVKYDGKAYPGVILSVEESDIEVKCMAKIGVNRFFWPSIDDICFYEFHDILTLIPEPQRIGTRHYEVRPTVWKIIESSI